VEDCFSAFQLGGIISQMSVFLQLGLTFRVKQERVGHDITSIRRAFVVIKAVLGWPWLWLLAPEPRL